MTRQSYPCFCSYISCLLLYSGLDKIEFLQSHENMDIYKKVFDMIEQYFGSEEEDTNLAPTIDPTAPEQFQFNPQQPANFNF